MSCENIDQYVIDVTPFFWELVRDIALLDYDTLAQTQNFQTIKECIQNNSSYVLRVNGNSFYYEDLNDLFNVTLIYCRQNYKTQTELLLLEKAVEIMNIYTKTDDLADMLEKL
jgi:hypothetical protein